MKKRKWLKAAAFALSFLLILSLLTGLVMPKYASASREGNLIREYYREDTPHDVLFVGDCEVYGNFDPLVLWDEFGSTSYIRGSAEQLIWQSYYLLEEMLERETPKAVVYNVLAMKHGAPDSEAYNRMTLDGMRWSGHKLGAIRASLTEGESLWEYLFPLLRFHSRWSELTGEDLRCLFRREPVSVNGYMPREGVKPFSLLPTKKPLTSYEFSDTVWEYLEKMRLLCEEKGVTLVLIKAPVLYPYWYEQWDSQLEEYAAEHQLAYWNMLELQEESGIDYAADTYDGGLHLNTEGAAKATRLLGRLLDELVELPDHRGDEALEARWQEKRELYRELLEAQKAEEQD